MIKNSNFTLKFKARVQNYGGPTKVKVSIFVNNNHNQRIAIQSTGVNENGTNEQWTWTCFFRRRLFQLRTVF